MPSVTVLTPTYNHAAFIAECIDSVRAQTFEDWEMVVLDDGSTDETLAIARAQTDPRIRVVSQHNRGLSRLAETYNRAASLGTGDLLAILEGDDLWPADKLERQVAEFDDPEVVLASGPARVTHGDPKLDYTLPQTSPPAHALRNDPVGSASLALLDVRHLTFTFPVSTVFRRSALERVGGFQQPPDLPLTDLPTFLALSTQGRFAWSSEVCGTWRRHPASTTASRLPLILDGVYRLVGEWLQGPGRSLEAVADGTRSLAEDWSAFMVHRFVLLAVSGATDRSTSLAAARKAMRFPGPPRRKAKAAAAWAATFLGLPEPVARRMTGTLDSSLVVNGYDVLVEPQSIDRVHPWRFRSP